MTCLDDLSVVLGGSTLRFAERHRAVDPRDGRTFFLVQAQEPGLSARLERVTNFVSGTELAEFIDGLDYRGWDGSVAWENADRDLAVRALFTSGGHIRLTRTLRPWRCRYGGWEASVVTSVEAGAEKDAQAADLREFLS